MKKTLVILIMLCLVLGLSAQLKKQSNLDQETENREKILKQEKKLTAEAKDQTTDDAQKKLQEQEKEHNMHLEKLQERNRVLQSEVNALKKSNIALQTDRNEYKTKWEFSQQKISGHERKAKQLQIENKELKSVNAKLRAKIDELKPPDKKKVKTIEQG